MACMESPEARLADVEYLEIQCKSALNSVKGMGFKWSLNPYIGCEHRCAFCYVRAYELRADRPFDDRYGRTVRVKVNVGGVLRSELARRSWRKETVVIGAATTPTSRPRDATASPASAWKPFAISPTLPASSLAGR
jgi:DNA repair photolyase